MTAPSPPGRAFRKAVSWLRRSRGRREPAAAGPAAREAPRTVWFHRGYRTVTGGSIKHSHYFEHVARMPGFAPKIALVGEPRNDAYARTLRELWPARDGAVVERWTPGPRDVLFVEGVDWRFLAGCGLENVAIPRINLIQGIQHVREGSERYGYLAERAIRVCVSQEVADAIAATGRPRGPVLTVPNGTDVAPFEPAGEGSPAGYAKRHFPVTILGYKNPDLAGDLSRRLHGEGVEHLHLRRFLDRGTWLGLLAETRVAVCLPYAEEGFYLPALEAMASGCIVVTLDCIGNRGFCRHDESCLIADPSPDSLHAVTKRALAMSPPELAPMHRRARDTVIRHSLDAEREGFHAVLGDVDRLWEMC